MLFIIISILWICFFYWFWQKLGSLFGKTEQVHNILPLLHSRCKYCNYDNSAYVRNVNDFWYCVRCLRHYVDGTYRPTAEELQILKEEEMECQKVRAFSNLNEILKKVEAEYNHNPKGLVSFRTNGVYAYRWNEYKSSSKDEKLAAYDDLNTYAGRQAIMLLCKSYIQQKRSYACAFDGDAQNCFSWDWSKLYK